MMDLTPDIKRIKDTAREINSLASRIDNCQKILKAMQKSEEKGLQLITELNISGFGVLDVSDDDMKPVLMQVAETLRLHMLATIEKSYDRIRELGGEL